MNPNKRNWTPYILILPSLIFLMLFFAFPMVRGLILAVWNSEASLNLHADASQQSAISSRIAQGSAIEILEQRGNRVTPGELTQNNQITTLWFRVRGAAADGATIEGWTTESRIRVRERDAAGVPTAGTVRRKLGDNVDPLTTLYTEPDEKSAAVGGLDAQASVAILEQATLEPWYLVRSNENGNVVQGWTPARYVQIFSEGTTGRVDRGNAGQFTTQYLSSMVNDRFFFPALGYTLLLMVLIIPVQFVLAIIMALVIQARLKGSTFFLYIFAIPLGVSDLAVGIVWFAIFTQNGFLNSFMQSLGLIDSPIAYLVADKRYWIIFVIWLAEVWRATSIVMVIVVSGLQAISDEVLEAAEVFGATFWQRLRFVILPMLRPSLQVALILRTILALQVFAVVIALSGGDVVTVLANEAYRQYYTLRNPNVAAAYSILILLISMATAVFYLRAVRTQEEAAI